MKTISKLAIPLFLLTIPMATTAQEEEEEAQTSYLYATYYYCDPTKEEAADEFVKKNFPPVYDKAVEDGAINAWGWLAHNTGGKWRRVLYHSANSVNELLDTADAMREAVGKATDNDMTLGASCKAHDDYIWQSESVGSMGEERGPAGFSVYYYCDQNRETRADEIVKETFAPVYNKLVADGKLTSWGWSGHFVGGKIRRLATMTGADHKSVLAARDEVIAAVYDAGGNEAGAEFSDICGDHVDYMWDIQYEKP